MYVKSGIPIHTPCGRYCGGVKTYPSSATILALGDGSLEFEFSVNISYDNVSTQNQPAGLRKGNRWMVSRATKHNQLVVDSHLHIYSSNDSSLNS